MVTFQGHLLQLCGPFATFSDMVQISHDAGEATRATLNTREITPFDMISKFLNSHKALNYHIIQIDPLTSLDPLQHFPLTQPFLIPGPSTMVARTSATKHDIQSV